MPSEDRTPTDAYDELAEEYVEEIESNPYNAHLEFPATTELIPDVDGKRVLDAGCGAGLYTEWLLEGGADVVGVDASEGMLERARERLDDAALQRVDLSGPLPFRADAFDGVVSGLALGYIEEWRPVFEEFRRVLADGGFVVFSVKHPFDEFPLPAASNYFETERYVKEWAVDVPYHRRPLSAVLNPVLEAGLRIDRVAEPRPTAAFEAAWPERYETESRQPVFLAVRAVG